MRLISFSDFIERRGYGAAFDKTASHAAHKRRQAYQDYRVLTAFDKVAGLNATLAHLRAKGKGASAQTVDQAFGKHRHDSKSPWEIVADIELNVVTPANKVLKDLAEAERDSHKALADVNDGFTVAHSALPAFDTPTGFMTPQAWKSAGGGDDIAAIGRILSGDTGGERSAPMGGYTHVHVAGNAHNVMSYDSAKKEIFAFTGHMDNTSPGKAQSRIASQAITEAGLKGWVWVAVFGGKLYRITSI